MTYSGQPVNPSAEKGVTIEDLSKDSFLNKSQATSFSIDLPGEVSVSSDGATGSLTVNGDGIGGCPEKAYGIDVCHKKKSLVTAGPIEIGFDLDFENLDLRDGQNPLTIRLKELEAENGNIFEIMERGEVFEVSTSLEVSNSIEYQKIIASKGVHNFKFTQNNIPLALAHQLSPEKVPQSKIEEATNREIEERARGWFNVPDWVFVVLITLLLIIVVALVVILLSSGIGAIAAWLGGTAAAQYVGAAALIAFFTAIFTSMGFGGGDGDSKA